MNLSSLIHVPQTPLRSFLFIDNPNNGYLVISKDHEAIRYAVFSSTLELSLS